MDDLNKEIKVIDFINLQLPLEKVLKISTREREMFLRRLFIGAGDVKVKYVAKMLGYYSYKTMRINRELLIRYLTEAPMTITQDEVVITIDDGIKIIISNEHCAYKEQGCEIYDLLSVNIKKYINLIESVTGKKVVLGD